MFWRGKRKRPQEGEPGGPGGERGKALEVRERPEDAAGGGSTGAVTGAATTQFLTGEAARDRRTVQVLLETIARVSRSRDLESLLRYVVDSSVQLTGAERGFLILKGPDGALQVRVARLRGGKPLEGDARFSTSVAGKVLEEIQAVRATVHSDAQMLELGKSVYDLKLRAVMCVPLTAPGEEGAPTPPGGVLYVDSRAATRQFSQRDLALFAALAQQISIAMENARLHIDSLEKVRLEQSLELASAIQRDLMPKVPADLPGWDVHGWYRPAEEAAGDFYDFVKARDGRLAIVVGDATGHGIGPALITATSQGSLRSYLRLSRDPAEALTLLNQDLCERVEDGRFLTLLVALLAPDGEVEILNAGHASPFVWRSAKGEVDVVAGGGAALGMIPNETYRAVPALDLAAGDALVVVTDGLSEARHPDEPERFFGDEGIGAALASAAAAGLDARGISLAVVEAALRASAESREDDATIVTARRTA